MAPSAITQMQRSSESRRPEKVSIESGRRDLNPRQPRWQRGALPLSYSRVSVQDPRMHPTLEVGVETASPVRNLNQYRVVSREFKASLANPASHSPSDTQTFCAFYLRRTVPQDSLKSDGPPRSHSSRRQKSQPHGLSTMNYVLQVVRGRSRRHDPQADRQRHQPRTPRRLCHPHQSRAHR